MQMIEFNASQIISLPLPSPALVIDTRGAEEENVMERLKIEIADLANEMKTQEVHHWRYLTEFLSFWTYEPMTVEEVHTLRPENLANANGSQPSNTPSSANPSPSNTIHRGLTGKIDPSTLKGFAAPFFQADDDIAPLTEDRPTEFLEQNIQRIIQEADRLRNNRLVAVTDVEKTMSGRSVKDATVRIFFLTDAERPDSLATTAAYAAHLKQIYAKKERSGQQSMINTVAVCLNNSSEAKPSSDLKELLWNGGWEHLDALILTEDYRQDAALIAGAIQTYLAELLLYVLMIVPPLRVGGEEQPPQAADATTSNGTQNANADKKGRSIPFPSYTFLVGLSAMEHSARWGRRLLNYKVVERAIEVLQKGTEDERIRTRNIVTGWLTNWREGVEESIPDKVPGNITDLQAIPAANKARKTVEKVFTLKDFSLNIGKSTITDLEDYLAHLKQTYRPQRILTSPQQTGPTERTLQEAVDSIPQIELHLREWESKDPELRRGTPLVNAQVEAQRILSHKAFFTGASGSISRAKMQLEELSNAIATFRGEHQQNPINLTERRAELEREGKKGIDDLKSHIASIPFLSTVLHLKQLMAWVTFILAILLSFIATFLGVAWFRHAINTVNLNSPQPVLDNLVSILNSVLLWSFSPLAIVFWLIVLGIVLTAVFSFGRKLLRVGDRSDFRVEIIFWLSLIVFALTGLLVSFSIVDFASDPNSLSIIAWFSFVPTLGAIFLIIAVLIALIEAVYFFWWYRRLQERRADIVSKLNKQHEQDVNDVKRFIADTIALHLLQHTGLMNEKGGPAEYFQRINQLSIWLKSVLENAQKQQRLARKRLAMSVSETQLGADTFSQGTWLNLGIRDELLDVDTLADGYNRLTASLGREMEELKEFAEMLLRIMGEESTAEVEQQFRERMPARGTIEQHKAQVLMTTLVAMALRLSINAASIYTMSPLIQQYENIAETFTHEPIAMRSLIESLRKKVRQNMLQPITEGRVKLTEMETTVLATNAFAAWGQMLWEGKDSELDKALSSEGVLPKLIEADYNAPLVKRLLGLRTSLFGRNVHSGQLGALYLLLPPSAQTHQFSHDLNLPRRHIIDFPDIERLILLYIQHYAGEPLFIPETPALPGAAVIGNNGSGSANALPPASASEGILDQSQPANTPSVGVASAANGSSATNHTQVSPQPVVVVDQNQEDAAQVSSTVGASVQPASSSPTTASMQSTIALPQANSGVTQNEAAPTQATNGSSPNLSPNNQPTMILDPGIPAINQINAFSPKQSVDFEALPLPSFDQIEDDEPDEEE